MRTSSPQALLCVLYGAAFLAGFNENLVNMALASVMAEFGISSVTAQWLVTGYMIVATVVVACMAFLYRRFSLRALFFGASAASLAGAIMGLCAPDFAWLLAARLVQALGTGVFIPLMMNTVLAVAPARKLGTYLAIGSGVITFGPAFAPVICGSLVTALGWRFVFLPSAAAMGAIAAAGLLFVRGHRASTAEIDLLSTALACAALFCLSFGLAEFGTRPHMAVFALGIAAASAAAFIARQLRCAHPLIDLAPARNPRFRPTLLLVTVAMMSMFSLSVLLPLYCEEALGITAQAAGVAMLAPVLTNVAVTMEAGRIMDKRGAWPLLPAGFALTALGYALAAFAAPHLSLPTMLAAAVVAFAGIGMVFSPSQTAGLGGLSSEEHPHGVALSSTCVQVAACIGPSLYIGIMAGIQNSAQNAGAAANDACAAGFAAAMGIGAAVAFVGCMTAYVYARQARPAGRDV